MPGDAGTVTAIICLRVKFAACVGQTVAVHSIGSEVWVLTSRVGRPSHQRRAWEYSPMETKILAGAAIAAAVVLSIGGAPPASATSNIQVVGIEEPLGDPNGSEIAYTVSKIVPSADAVAYPVA